MINKHYKDDMSFNIRLNRWILKSIGIWPKFTEKSHIEKIFQWTMHVVCNALICFEFIPCLLYGVLEVKETYNRLRLTGPLSFLTMGILKYCSLILQENNLRECLRHIETDWKKVWRPRDRTIMLENAKFGHRLITICAFFMYGAGILYHAILPVIGGKMSLDDGNATFWPLGFPVAIVIADTHYSPTNEIFFSIQCLTGFIVHSIAVACCSLAAIFAMHACGQMEIAISWVEHLVDGNKDEEDSVDDRLAYVIHQHVRALNFVSRMEGLLQNISFVEVIGCTLDMCLLGYYCIMEWDFSEPFHIFTYVMLLVSVTFNIFIFCYIGELVHEHSKKVGEVSYMIEWYRLPGKKGLDVILIIAMASCSTKMTAGNFIELSLSSFGDVIKSSVAYLNLLRTVTS